MKNQTLSAYEWIIILNGKFQKSKLDKIKSILSSYQNIKFVRRLNKNIISSLRAGLEISTGEYIIPIDGDDLITADAIEIFSNEIIKSNYPDFIYSDENILKDGTYTNPYYRSNFDEVLAVDSSVIWHMYATPREKHQR